MIVGPDMSRSSSILWLLPLFLLSIKPLVAATPPIQSYDTYKSWFAVCDNGLSCVAKTVGESDASEVTLSREAGPSGQIELKLAVSPQTTVSQIRVDGEPINLALPAWRVMTQDDITTITSSNPEAIQALIGQLRQASTITMGADHVISLEGLTAALLRIDDRQGRIGTQTALIRPGPRPASSALAPPALPHIPYRPIAERISRQEGKRLEGQLRRSAGAIFRQQECEQSSLAKTPEINALDSGKALIFVECVQGAYQASSLAFIASRQTRAIQQVLLETPYLGAPRQRTTVSWFTNASFDPKTGALAMFAKGRGLTDCGMSAGWIWNGHDFALSAITQQDACGGVQAGDWPVLFRSTH